MLFYERHVNAILREGHKTFLRRRKGGESEGWDGRGGRGGRGREGRGAEKAEEREEEGNEGQRGRGEGEERLGKGERESEEEGKWKGGGRLPYFFMKRQWQMCDHL